MSFFGEDTITLIIIKQRLITLSVWTLPAGVTAWFAVHHYDTPYREDENPTYWQATMAQIVIAGFIFFLSAWSFAQLWHKFNTPNEVEQYTNIIMTFSIFIAFMMACIAGFMSYIFQKSIFE